MNEVILRALPLTVEVFAPFGDVIETSGRFSRPINDHTCLRYDDLATVDVAEAGGRPLISIFEASPRSLPLQIRGMERHPLSSQAFVPLEARRFLVVVATVESSPWSKRLRVFLSPGGQGVNFHRGTWHHSLIALDQVTRFLVVDRGGPEGNCEEVIISDEIVRVTVT